MTTYQDISFLCALYREQDNSRPADAFRAGMAVPLLVTPLLEFEFRQAARLQVWLHGQDKRKGYGPPEADLMLADWETDIAAGRIQIVPADADAVLRQAEHLSRGHTAKLGNRTLDILHIATAVHLQVEQFLTFDARQRQLARAAGLKTPL